MKRKYAIDTAILVQQIARETGENALIALTNVAMLLQRTKRNERNDAFSKDMWETLTGVCS